ncbi:hypothetical protein L6Q96_17190 [Candidatus Binatia bacterium]|nr:hypothetical protein [Candidatus Binatia bacterium]
MSRFFVERPILAHAVAIVAIVTLVLGLVCLLALPVAQYPEIVPPTAPARRASNPWARSSSAA